MPTHADRRFPSVLLCMLTLAALAAGAIAGPLDDELNDLLQEIDLGAAEVGIYAVDLQTGRELMSLDEDSMFIPASNQKLLTSGAALMVLGPDFTFRTRLRYESGSLILQGDGDPAFGDPEILAASHPPMTFDGLLDGLSGAVPTDAEVREIVIDDRVFDRELVHPTWPARSLNRWYCAEVSGLNIHTNTVNVYVSPAPGGAGAPRFMLEPDIGVLSFRNRARTVTSGMNTVWIARPRPANEFTIFGKIRRAAQIPIRATLHDPAMIAGQQLRDALAKTHEGVTEETEVRRVEHAEDVESAPTLAVVTTPIAEVLRRCNVDSHNLYAESLLKRLAYETTLTPGGWSAGASIIRMNVIERLGTDLAGSISIQDGSGMSRENLVTPRLLAAWLENIAMDDEISSSFMNSLPSPGEGTLTSRFRDVPVRHRVRAKSGYLNGVYSLSGYITDRQTGRTAAFSMMINHGESTVRRAKEFHERAVAIIDEWLTEQSGAPAPANLGG